MRRRIQLKSCCGQVTVEESVKCLLKHSKSQPQVVGLALHIASTIAFDLAAEPVCTYSYGSLEARRGATLSDSWGESNSQPSQINISYMMLMQITLPARFLSLTAHLATVLTVFFDIDNVVSRMLQVDPNTSTNQSQIKEWNSTKKT